MFTRRFWSLLIITAILSFPVIAGAQVSTPRPETIIPLEGLDPVLLSQGKEVQGDMKYKVTRGPFQYLFASAENKTIFEQDPARYEIQLNGHCARMGAPTSGNPDLYTVHNGRIYVFGSEECQTLFKAAPEKYLEVPVTPKAPPSSENVKRGQALLTKAVELLGGASKLDQLVSFKKTELRQNQVRNTLVLGFPDAVRQEIVRPTFTIAAVVTPAESFVLVNNTARPMSEANRAAVSKELFRELIVLLRSRTRPDFKVWLAGEDTVEIELPDFNTTLGIDSKTGRVIHQTYRGRGPGGVVGQIVINYSDFRAVEGLSLPFKMTATFDGQPYPDLSTTVEAITINGQIDPSTFQKPQTAAATPGAVAQSSDWTQWGGPHRNFKSEAKGLATTWPATGPRRLWQRELGEGYSGIAVERGVLFTMYRKAENEIAVALDAATGKTIWEYSYAAPFSPEYDMSNGPGPHATPLVSSDMVITSGATGKLHSLDKKTGKVLWSHDLLNEFRGTLRVNGYSCSPIAYNDKIVMMVGGPSSSFVAFNRQDGSVAWKKHDFRNSTSSPLIINVDGQDQLVAFMYSEIVAVDPNNGNLLWSHPHPVDHGLNTSTPVWGPDNLLFVSSGYGGGSRVLKLSRTGDKTSVEELWAHGLMRIHFTNAIRVGDLVYGSSGDFGPAPFTAVDVKTGKVRWRHRGFPRASVLFADARFIILDEDGNLLLATATPEGLTVTSKVELLSSHSWTVPSLAGTRLYLRDRKNIMALELGVT